jgi:hypothetical protein
MSKLNELIDQALEDINDKVDKYTLNAFSTLVFSMITEEDYAYGARIKELIEKVVARCDAGIVHYHKTEGEPAESSPFS